MSDAHAKRVGIYSAGPAASELRSGWLITLNFYRKATYGLRKGARGAMPDAHTKRVGIYSAGPAAFELCSGWLKH